MLGVLKELLAALGGKASTPGGETERTQLETAVTGLLLEMMRVDLEEKPEEAAVASAAIASMFGLDPQATDALVARASAHRYASYFGPVGVIKRLLDLEQRIVLVEHLWRIAFADTELDPYEDHFVRKIAHLLYVPNTDAMLARQRAKGGVNPKVV